MSANPDTNPDSNDAQACLNSLHLISIDDVFGFSTNKKRQILDLADECYRVPSNASDAEMLRAILRLQHARIRSQSTNSEGSGKTELEKLLKMDMAEVISLSSSDLPQLVHFMKCALKYEPSLNPSTFDVLNPSVVAQTAIKWQLQMQSELDTPRPVPDVPPPSASSSDANPPTKSLARHATQNKNLPARFAGPATRPSFLERLGISDQDKTHQTEEDDEVNSGDSDSSARVRRSYHLGGRTVKRKTKTLGVSENYGAEILENLLTDHDNLTMVIRNKEWKRDDNNRPKGAECEAVTLARMIDLIIRDYSNADVALSKHTALEVGLRRLYALVVVENHVVSGRSNRSSAWEMCDSILETLPSANHGVRGLDAIMTAAVLRNQKKRKALQELDNNPRSRRKKYFNKGSSSKTGMKEPDAKKPKTPPKGQN